MQPNYSGKEEGETHGLAPSRFRRGRAHHFLQRYIVIMLSSRVYSRQNVGCHLVRLYCCLQRLTVATYLVQDCSGMLQ